MTDGREVRLVLDASAIASWMTESLAVGEVLAEVDSEHGAALIPFWCLVEAGHTTGGLAPERLELLLAHPATFLIVDDGDEWRTLVALRSLVDRIDCAAAAYLALEMGVDVMTRHPGWYRQVADGRIVLEIED